MNCFERSIYEKVGAENYEKISGAVIGIIGCGGLGSNAAVCLARSGFKNFILMDFDKIEYGNLNRQYYFFGDVGRFKAEVLRERLISINPSVEAKVFIQKLNDENIEFFSKADAVVEAVDTAETKADIVSFGAKKGILTVSSSGMAGYGDAKDMTVKKIGGVYVTGDMKSGISDTMHPYAPKVSAAAALEADIILAHFMGCDI
ncbi:MAG: sulfur carrier protein ThiS adenylyltransferase ThiF [Oscillospiraceae bacterium]|nr:sulfur carrier protein ThiS adenylyltransferase ThiF [Oscillospiraceae bacterium]